MDRLEDQFVDDQIEALAPTQHPGGFVVAPVFQVSMAMMVRFIDALTQVGVVPVAPVMSQAGGRVQAPITRTLEQLLAAARLEILSAMSADEQKGLERSKMLFSPYFKGGVYVDA